MRREWQWGGGQREEEMERGAVGKVGGKMGRGQQGGGKDETEWGWGAGEEGTREGRFHRWI